LRSAHCRDQGSGIHARQVRAIEVRALSRIYKVLLDLMVVKTVASFTARPLLWFGLLSMPLMLIGGMVSRLVAVELGHAGAFRCVTRNGAGCCC
jgi:hypothetical protein